MKFAESVTIPPGNLATTPSLGSPFHARAKEIRSSRRRSTRRQSTPRKTAPPNETKSRRMTSTSALDLSHLRSPRPGNCSRKGDLCETMFLRRFGPPRIGLPRVIAAMSKNSWTTCEPLTPPAPSPMPDREKRPPKPNVKVRESLKSLRKSRYGRCPCPTATALATP
jgi:hypothetical protein